MAECLVQGLRHRFRSHPYPQEPQRASVAQNARRRTSGKINSKFFFPKIPSPTCLRLTVITLRKRMRVNLLCIYSSLNRIRRAPAKLAESRPRPIVLTKNNQLEQKTIWNNNKKRKNTSPISLGCCRQSIFGEQRPRDSRQLNTEEVLNALCHRQFNWRHASVSSENVGGNNGLFFFFSLVIV